MSLLYDSAAVGVRCVCYVGSGVATWTPQDFEETILNDLYQAIIMEFPEPPAVRSTLDLERSYHMHFVEDKSMHFIGRTVCEAHAFSAVTAGQPW